MPTIIDGTGAGNVAQVDANNRLRVESVSLTQEANESQKNAEVYSAASGATDLTNPNGVVLYVKNTNANKLLVMESIVWSFTAAGAVIRAYTNVTGTPATTTAVDQVNIHVGSGKVADADVFTTSGTGITGLTTDKLAATYHEIPAGILTFDFEGALCLDQNANFAVIVDTDGAGSAYTGGVAWTIQYRFVDPS